jgi:hypothetical protein
VLQDRVHEGSCLWRLLSLFELAEKGDPVSQLKLGDYYYSKKNNIDEAKKWWSKAAEQGNKDAKFNLDYYKHQPFRRWFMLAFIFIIVIPFLILAILG